MKKQTDEVLDEIRARWDGINDCGFTTMDMGAWIEVHSADLGRAEDALSMAQIDIQYLLTKLEQATRKRNIAHSSERQDWMTPPELVSAVLAWGGADLVDPCPAVDPGNWFAENNLKDGLADGWYHEKRFFLNPPYGTEYRKLWGPKILKEAELGKEIVTLVKCDPSTKMWQRMNEAAQYVHFFSRRVKFIDPDTGKERQGAGFASCAFAFNTEMPPWPY